MRRTLHVRYVMHNNMLNQTQVLQHRCDTPMFQRIQSYSYAYLTFYFHILFISLRGQTGEGLFEIVGSKQRHETNLCNVKDW